MWEYTFQVTWNDTKVTAYHVECSSYWRAWAIFFTRFTMAYDAIDAMEDVKIINIQAIP